MSPTSCQTAPPRGAECTGTTAVRQTKPFGGSIAALQYLVTHRNVHLSMLARLCSMLFATFSPQRCAEQMDTIGSERLWQATGYKTGVSAGASGATDISYGLCRRLASVGQPSTRCGPTAASHSDDCFRSGLTASVKTPASNSLANIAAHSSRRLSNLRARFLKQRAAGGLSFGD